jgi:uncharacterized protein YegP (UPF0339 family)
MVYYVYREREGSWRWRRIAARGMTIVSSEERYAAEEDCAAAVRLMKTSGPAPVCVLRHVGDMGQPDERARAVEADALRPSGCVH